MLNWFKRNHVIVSNNNTPIMATVFVNKSLVNRFRTETDTYKILGVDAYCNLYTRWLKGKDSILLKMPNHSFDYMFINLRKCQSSRANYITVTNQSNKSLEVSVFDYATTQDQEFKDTIKVWSFPHDKQAALKECLILNPKERGDFQIELPNDYWFKFAKALTQG